MPVGLALGVITSALVGVGVAEAVTDPPDTLPLSEVKPGMKGYGLTVFSGTNPERFDVEVISTLKNFRPNQDLILIKTPNHPRLDVARTVGGMSGSPIYLNGKMIGAYAYGWLFGVEPIAGVTPIKSMLEELARPMPKAIMPIPGKGPLPAADDDGRVKRDKHARAFHGTPEGYDLQGHATQLASRASSLLAPPEGSALARASTPIMLGGLSGTSLKIAQNLLGPMGMEPLQAGGGSSTKPSPDAPTKFVDGGAIGVEMIRGDISAMGLGTVTRVSGDKLVAFGHPMLGGGIEALPTAVARVHWIMASQNRSFKIGEAVRSVGALVNDRQAAIVVDSSVKAPVFPMKVTITAPGGVPHPTWNMEVAQDQFLSPTFVAMAIGNAFETSASERNDLTYRATSKLKIGRWGTITLTDFGAGNGNPPGAEDFVRGRLVRAIGSLLNNPWEPVSIEGVETEVKVSYEREVVTLRGAKILEPEIDAGAKVHIQLELQRFQGKIETKVIEVDVPTELAGREVEIELAPGYEVERPLPSPENVAQLVANLPNQTFDPESVVASFRLRENGASYKGKIASRLPAGALDTLRSSVDSDTPETFVAQVQSAVPLKQFMVGRDTVRVKVRNVLR
ncbi:SpoIVB peptidase S55 domain-containing protein [Polyangium sp. y55x31]|uniref:SpoIVB peptidase S55 domain-containing protein n=1 Tax=Polyangium sp. y55x31 TaxID=3042688 RepID=UPI0024830C7A|nr:SpoIVB peptidase S55 domain-containing protein [Polyangium sp. y55x31]MDI1484044.1 SpoIVB peptidase S55 domain-containing protein [Polyangium sp. y55x31]